MVSGWLASQIERSNAIRMVACGGDFSYVLGPSFEGTGSQAALSPPRSPGHAAHPQEPLVSWPGSLDQPGRGAARLCDAKLGNDWPSCCKREKDGSTDRRELQTPLASGGGAGRSSTAGPLPRPAASHSSSRRAAGAGSLTPIRPRVSAFHERVHEANLAIAVHLAWRSKRIGRDRSFPRPLAPMPRRMRCVSGKDVN